MKNFHKKDNKKIENNFHNFNPNFLNRNDPIDFKNSIT